MADPTVFQPYTYPGSQTPNIFSDTINSDGTEVVTFGGPPPPNYQYTVTVTDSYGSVHIHESYPAAPSFAGNDYYGQLTGYSNGGDFTVRNHTEVGSGDPTASPTSNVFTWLFVSAVDTTGTVTLYNDGRSGAFVPPACFAEGSHILTTRGEIAVEALTVGDEVVTHCGAVQPVIWIGHRRVDPARTPAPDDFSVIRIGAHAFGDNKPHRDLRLSPDHSVFVDGALIPIRHLVNGATIVREAAAPVTYYHVEVAEQAVLLAEGLPAESYLDTGNRSAFGNGGPTVRLHPMLARQAYDDRACAPTLDGGPRLDIARRTLIARARDLGFAMTDDPAVVLVVDGSELAARQDGSALVFDVPAGQLQDIRLRSRSDVPAWTCGTDDHRRLGMALTQIGVRDADAELLISAHSGVLSAGFHDCEGDGRESWRWTDGEAHLPATLFAAFPDGCELVLRLRGRMTYWLGNPQAEPCRQHRQRRQAG